MTPNEHRFAKARVSNLRAAEMGEYLDARLHLSSHDESTFARALLLAAELHGISYAARECGLSSESLRRQLNGSRPLYLHSVRGVMRVLGIHLRIEVIP
ncbi:hypothetical protein [Stenotrophomonas chelatiphaga]|uniref:hypothetical protein n=1 Tax=Stenotrophomonas chelatiphaga TaxID=517011 RepID=UPI0028985C70|nr:hypothetical protein [Stenotrophomonas chelatiphaga]